MTARDANGRFAKATPGRIDPAQGPIGQRLDAIAHDLDAISMDVAAMHVRLDAALQPHRPYGVHPALWLALAFVLGALFAVTAVNALDHAPTPAPAVTAPAWHDT